MKKMIGMGMAVVMVGAMALPALARDAGKGEYRADYHVMLEGTQQSFHHANGAAAWPVVYDGTTYLPLRAIGEIMGKNVNWNEATKTIDISGKRTGERGQKGQGATWTKKDVGIQERSDFTINIDGTTQLFRRADGTAMYPIVCEGSTYLPLRAVGELMGKEVIWNNDTKTASLSTKNTVTDADTFTKDPAKGNISIARAKEIALAHAKLGEKEVRFSKAKLDREDGGRVYEIEFYNGKVEYDYDIHAISGEILSMDKELDDADMAVSGQSISEAAAKKVVLEHSGIKSGDMKAVKIVQKEDDGYLVYEIEFNTTTMEYDYTVDAVRGIVLEYSKEKIYGTSATKKAQVSNTISLDDAKALVLTHAGLKASTVTFTKAELDTNDGVKEYEFEFYSGKFEYECSVNATTGKITEFEKDDRD